MKNKILIIILLLSAGLFSAQNSKNLLNETILKIVKAYQNKDAKTINSFVDKNWGITFIYQPGAHTALSTVDKIDFKKPIPDYLPYSFSMKETKVIHANTKTEFDCSTEKFNVKDGIYYEKVTSKNSIATINDFNIKNSGKEFGIDRKLVREISSGAIKVTAFGGNRPMDNTFVFYLTPKNGKWILTAIDRFEVCSA